MLYDQLQVLLRFDFLDTRKNSKQESSWINSLAFSGESNPIFASCVTFPMKAGDSCPNGRLIPKKGPAQSLFIASGSGIWALTGSTLVVMVDIKKNKSNIRYKIGRNYGLIMTHVAWAISLLGPGFLAFWLTQAPWLCGCGGFRANAGFETMVIVATDATRNIANNNEWYDFSFCAWSSASYLSYR